MSKIHKGGVGPAEIHVNNATASLSGEVRRILPGLAHRSRRWSRAGICPECSGKKSPDAIRCRDCFRQDYDRRRAIYRATRAHPGAPTPTLQDPRMRPAQWRRGMIGVDRPLPPLTRKVLGADGVWRDAE